MGIRKVVLDICSLSKHLKGISTGENGGKKRDGGMKRRGMEEVYLNWIIRVFSSSELFLYHHT